MKKIIVFVLIFLLAVGSLSAQHATISDYITQSDVYADNPDAPNYALELYNFMTERIRPTTIAEDEMCQAIALANNYIYSISDDETKAEIKSDMVKHYCLYLRIREYQRIFRIKLNIDELPLLAKAIWAYRVHGMLETDADSQKLTLQYYKEFVDQIESYEYLFSRLKNEHFENYHSLESLAQTMEEKIRDTADFHYVNAYDNNIHYEEYLGKSRRWDQFAWLNYQVGLMKTTGKARGDCVTACLLQIAYYKLMGIPAFAEEISTVQDCVYSHNSPRHYNQFTSTWVAAQMPQKYEDGYHVYFIRPKLHHQFLQKYPRSYYNSNNPGQFVTYDLIVSNRQLGFSDSDIETMMFHKVENESNNEFFVNETNWQIPLADTDKDGLYDVWETRFGTNVNEIDSDGDGLSDLFELQANMSPLCNNETSANTDVVIDGIADFEKNLSGIVSASDPEGDYTSNGEIHDVNMVYAKTEGENLYVGVTYHNDIRENTRQIRTLTVTCHKNNARQQEVRFQWVGGCKCNVYRNNYDTLIATAFIPMKFITNTETLIPLVYFGDADQLDIQYRATGTIDGKSTNSADYSGIVTVNLSGQSSVEKDSTVNSVLIIPEETTEIPNWKYRGQTDFSGVVLPSSLTRIGENAFRETNLKTVVIPEGVQQVGLRAFYQCTELEEISFPSTVDTIPYACFTSAEKLSKVIINEGVRGIGEYAFNNCVSITEITIPGSVKKISDMAFRACSGLTQLTLEDGIEEIGREAFSSCSNLQSVVIPESVKTIGYMAFSKKTTLIVVAGSEAHKYAVENGYQFEAVGNGELNLEEFTLTVDKLLNDSEFLHLANIQTPQSGKVFAIGDEGPAGGIIFYANAANNTYLEVKLIDGTYNWNDAKQAAVSENWGGFSDWRLPLLEELNLIYNAKDKLNIEFGTARYWTSARDGVKNSPYVWFVDFADGKSYHNSSAGLSALHRVALVRTVSENLFVESDGDRYELSPYVGQWNHTDALVVAEAYSQLTREEWSLPTVTQMQKLQSCFSEPHFSKYWMHNGNSETASYYDATKGTYGKIASEKLENVRLIKVANASNVSDYVYLNLQTHWNQNGDYRLAFTDDTYMGCGNLAIAQILLYHKLLPKNMQIDLSKVENELKETTPQENKLETSRYIYAVSSKKVVENFDVERAVYEYPKQTTQSEMEQLIVNELSVNRPMMIHCYNAAKTSDHAMVVDGVRHVGDKLQVHLLFGWNGDYDGWFYLWEPINTTMINLDNEYRGIETYVPKAQNESQTSVTESVANVNIYIYGKTIIVENATDEILVYDVMGRLVCRDATPCVRAELRMNDVGVYVVKVGNFAKKVIVE